MGMMYLENATQALNKCTSYMKPNQVENSSQLEVNKFKILNSSQQETILHGLMLQVTQRNFKKSHNVSMHYQSSNISMIQRSEMLYILIRLPIHGIYALLLTILQPELVQLMFIHFLRANIECLSTLETLMAQSQLLEPYNGFKILLGLSLMPGDHTILLMMLVNSKLLVMLSQEKEDSHSLQFMELVIWHPNGKDNRLIMLSSTLLRINHYEYKTYT